MRPCNAVLAALAALCAAPSAWAHDFWLQPSHFRPPPGGDVEALMYVGHGPDREIWNVPAERVLSLQTIGASGRSDMRTAIGGPIAGRAHFRFATPGAHVIALVSNDATSILPAARFQAYAEDAGLTEVLRHRARTHAQARDGRELYSRRAKAIVQVGAARPGADAFVTTPIGHTLEIVPERNPYALRIGEQLPVRVYYLGAPLAGARITMTDLANDAQPVGARRTDRNGRAAFPLRSGRWMLNVVWSRPIEGDARADYQTIFSSLTFGRE